MSHQVTLSWVATPDAGATGFQGYNIYRGTAAGAESTTPLNASPVNALTYQDTSPVLGEDFYVVKSVVNGVIGTASNEVSTAVLPAPPTNLTVVSSN
jgi:titin